MTTPIHGLICAEPDLNLIDGSSIWLQSMALALAGTESIRVDVLSKTSPSRSTLFEPLQSRANIRVIDGPQSLPDSPVVSGRLNVDQLAALAASRHAEHGYDFIVVRGFRLARACQRNAGLFSRVWLYLTDIPQELSAMSAECRDELAAFAPRCRRVLCQSEGFRRLWLQVAPHVSPEKFVLSPPIVPDCQRGSRIHERERLAVYAGKFKPEWQTLEMVRLWRVVLERAGEHRLSVYGDKIHDVPSWPTYAKEMRQALRETPGVVWQGAVPRSTIMQALARARVALAWRAESLNDSLEVSTKVLEYGSAGCAVVLSRTPLHEHLLGSDYPLFANDAAGYVQAVARALCDNTEAEDASERIWKVAQAYQMSRAVQRMKNWATEDRVSLAPAPSREVAGRVKVARPSAPLRVLVAGHDLRFFAPIMRELGSQFEFLVDDWQGHSTHDKRKSQALLQHADVIFCEWCLGNIEWYSRHKREHQRLYGRLHNQELNTRHLCNSKYENIDGIVFVSEHTRRAGVQRFGLEQPKTRVIPNGIDIARFAAVPKISEDTQCALGMIGYVPSLKRLDRAFDLLEVLRRRSPRYMLRIKGQHPFDYGWLVNRPGEVRYYAGLLKRINGSDLRHAVVFDPPGSDVAEWLSLVGHILSPSDAESFHMAVAEGMASGCAPIVWDRPGARALWPDSGIVKSVEEAAEKVEASRRSDTRSDGEVARAYVQRYSLQSCAAAYSRLFSQTGNCATSRSSALSEFEATQPAPGLP